MKTLRAKITIIVSVLLVSTMGLLTAYSILNSNRHFVIPIQQLALDNVHTLIPIKSTTLSPILNFDATTYILMEKLEIAEATNFSASVAATATNAQKEFGITQSLVMLLIVFLGILLTDYLVNRALKPLHTLNKAAVDIDAHKLNTQISVSASHDEVATLTSSFNSMLTRLNSSFELQKSFAQNAAHELKTPLAVIKSSLQVLALDDEPTLEDYRENAQMIAESTDALIEIVGQLLALTENVEIERQALSLKTLIHNSLDEHSAEIAKMGLSVRLTLDQATIYTNDVLAERIFSNIISNGIKYNKPNGALFIHAYAVDDKTRMVFCDKGIGIDQADLTHIFEPFYRVDPSRSKEISGNGLGLAIVKVMVEKLGGTISVSSAPSVGTTVTLELP